MILENDNWRDLFHPEEKVQRWRPKYIEDYLENPHKGTTTFQRFEGDDLYPGIRWNDREGPLWFKPPRKGAKNKRYPPTRSSYCRWLWSDIETEKGHYKWEIIEGALEAAKVRNQMLQLRIQPYIYSHVPEWFWGTGAPFDEEIYKREDFKSPDCNSEQYIQHWSEFIMALGEKFDGHPNLEFMDVAYAGNCGETGGNSTPETARILIDVYLKSFQKTQLIGLLGTKGNAYLTQSERNVGWRADCFGDCSSNGKGYVPDGLNWNHMLESYPREVAEDGVGDSWHHSPVIFETCWTVAYWEKQGWDIDWILDQGLKYHISSFMPKSVYIPDKWMDKIMEFNKKIGYRFFIHNFQLPLDVRPGESREFQLIMDNKGIAPIYVPYKFALRFEQGDKSYISTFEFDLRKCLPDFTYINEFITIPKDLLEGDVEVYCAIVNEELCPTIKMAIEGIQTNGWYPISKMSVLK